MRVWRNDMSPENDLLNTYRVSGQERLRTLYHLEAAKGLARERRRGAGDIPVDVRIATAVARLTEERLQCAEPEVELMQAA
jgi:hypothetical protein